MAILSEEYKFLVEQLMLQLEDLYKQQNEEQLYQFERFAIAIEEALNQIACLLPESLYSDALNDVASAISFVDSELKDMVRASHQSALAPGTHPATPPQSSN